MQALVHVETILETLWHAHLLCEVCEQQPWTQRGARLAVLLCADCASNEPEDDE